MCADFQESSSEEESSEDEAPPPVVVAKAKKVLNTPVHDQCRFPDSRESMRPFVPCLTAPVTVQDSLIKPDILLFCVIKSHTSSKLCDECECGPPCENLWPTGPSLYCRVQRLLPSLSPSQPSPARRSLTLTRCGPHSAAKQPLPLTHTTLQQISVHGASSFHLVSCWTKTPVNWADSLASGTARTLSCHNYAVRSAIRRCPAPYDSSLQRWEQ